MNVNFSKQPYKQSSGIKNFWRTLHYMQENNKLLSLHIKIHMYSDLKKIQLVTAGSNVYKFKWEYVQETLNTGAACLEFHFEASQAYLDIVEQSAIVDPDLCNRILHAVLQNLEAQDPSSANNPFKIVMNVVQSCDFTVLY